VEVELGCLFAPGGQSACPLRTVHKDLARQVLVQFIHASSWFDRFSLLIFVARSSWIVRIRVSDGLR
jgi:hypothetical protein